MYVCCVHFPGAAGVKYLSAGKFTRKLSEARILNEQEVHKLEEYYNCSGFAEYVRWIFGDGVQVEFRQVFERKVLSLIDPNLPRRKGRERKRTPEEIAPEL